MTNDETDRHVLAAAVRGGGEVLVTFNTKDFPADSVEPFDLEVLRHDGFLLEVLSDGDLWTTTIDLGAVGSLPGERDGVICGSQQAGPSGLGGIEGDAVRSGKGPTATAAVGAILVGTMLAGCAATGGHVAGDVATTAPARTIRPTVSQTIPTAAYAVAYDPFRNSIWYATMTSQVSATLYEADAVSGSVEARFTLPAGQTTGVESDIVVAPDRSIWVSEGYDLVRVDPSSGRISSLPLPLDVAGALPDALSAGAEDPGTWISSLAATSDSIVVGRDNVPFLQQYSFSLQPEANVPLPAGDSGPTALTTTSAGILADIADQNIQADAGKIVTLPFPAGAKPAVATTATARAGTPLQTSDLNRRAGNDTEVVSADGTPLVDVDPTAHVLTWQVSSSATAQIVWPATPIVVHGPPSPTSPDGADVKTFTEPQLDAATVTPAGDLWIVKTEFGATTAQLQEYASH